MATNVKKIGFCGFELTTENGTVLLTVPKESIRNDVTVSNRCDKIMAAAGVTSLAAFTVGVVATKNGNIETAEKAVKVVNTALDVGFIALAAKGIAMNKLASKMGLKEAFANKHC